MSVGAPRYRLWLPTLALAAAVLATAAAYGIAVRPPEVGQLLIGIAGLAALLVAARRPDVGAALLLAVVLLFPREVLFEEGVPGLGGKVKATDLLLLTIVVAWAARRSLGVSDRRLPDRAVVVLLLLVFAACAVSLWTARGSGTPLDLSLQELRPLLAYALVFPIVGEARSIDDLYRGLWLLLGVGVVASVVTIGQWAGARAPGNGGPYGEIVRVLDDAFLGPLFVVVSAAALFPFVRSGRARAVLVGSASIGLVGLFVTFQRGAWVAAAVAVAATVLLLSPRYRRRLAPALAGVALITLLAASISTTNTTNGAADPVAAGVARVQSIASFESDASASHRYAEWREAISKIEDHPLIGIGLGTGIVFYSPLFRAETDTLGGGFATYYIHNSYIWFALKLGVLGAAAFFAMVLVAMWTGLRAYRASASPKARPLLLAALAGLIALLILSLTGPHLSFDRSSTYAAVLIGVLQVIPRVEPRTQRAADDSVTGTR